jgi:hypothetical protein
LVLVGLDALDASCNSQLVCTDCVRAIGDAAGVSYCATYQHGMGVRIVVAGAKDTVSD